MIDRAKRLAKYRRYHHSSSGEGDHDEIQEAPGGVAEVTPAGLCLAADCSRQQTWPGSQPGFPLLQTGWGRTTTHQSR